jgi:hypothetical protein
MRMRILILAVLAMAFMSGVALAAKPPHPSTPASTNANSNSNQGATTTTKTTHGSTVKVLWVIRGTIGSYVAANGSTNGSISLMLKSSSLETNMLKAAAQPLSFGVSSKTKVELHNGKPLASGDRVTIKVRAPKNSSVSTLATMTAFQVLDQGSAA